MKTDYFKSRHISLGLALLTQSCKATVFPSQSGNYIHISSHHLSGEVRFNKLVGQDQILGISNQAFYHRFQRTLGPIPVIAFMDSCGYDLKAMTGRKYGGILAFRQDYDLIFKKK